MRLTQGDVRAASYARKIDAWLNPLALGMGSLARQYRTITQDDLWEDWMRKHHGPKRLAMEIKVTVDDTSLQHAMALIDGFNDRWGNVNIMVDDRALRELESTLEALDAETIETETI